MSSQPNLQDAQSESFPAKYARWVIKYRWPVLLTSILLVMGLGSGGQFIAFDSDYHVFFSEENPQLQAFDELQAKYTKDDNVFIVLEPENGNMFTRENLAAMEELTDSAWQTPFSSRVDAITNFQHTKAVEDDLYVDDLVENAQDKTDEELFEIKEIATNEPLLIHRLVNEDGSIGAVNITVKLPGEDITEGNQVIAHARKITQELEAKYPGIKTHLSGMIMLNGAFFEASQSDSSTLIPLMFLVILVVIFLTTRSVMGTVVSLVVIIFSIMAAMGATGWLGIKLTPPSAAAPTIILTLAVADSIHLLITFLQYMRKGHTKREAIVESIRLNFMPVFITSLTTVFGFLTMNLSDVPPFHDLGNITAIGMTAAFLFSITSLPALLAILPVKVKVKEERPEKEAALPFLDKLANFVIGNRHAVLWGSAAAVIGISLLAVNNDLNDEFIDYFDESIAFRTDTDFISDKLTGIYNIEYSLGAGESGGVNNPKYLERLYAFEEWLYEQPEIIHVNSYAEVAKRVNKSMHGDSLSYYKIPENREEAAQFLLLYELSLPFGLDLNNQINVDKSETRVTATVENLSSNEMIAFNERAENWLVENAPEYMHTSGTSATLIFSHLSRRQVNSMITSSILAIVLISLCLILALRSVKYGILSIIPNVAPIAVGFGIWAMVSGVINVGIAIVFGMTLGIIVDDTVHFLSKYLRARREQNASHEQAVRYAFSTVGKALLVTTFVLISGFIILAQSSFLMNSGMAKITAIIITLALILDFLMLPALLLVIGGKSSSGGSVPSGTQLQGVTQ
ncbi:MAG: MMPL family transporter [Bacteroidota bacterium]